MNKAIYAIPLIALLMLGSVSAFSVAFTGTGITFLNPNAMNIQAGFLGQPVYVINNNPGDNYQLRYSDFNLQNSNINNFNLYNSTSILPEGIMQYQGIYTLSDLSQYKQVSVGNTLINVYENVSFALVNIGSIPSNVLQNDSLNTNALTSNILANVMVMNSQLSNSFNGVVANSIAPVNANVLSLSQALNLYRANESALLSASFSSENSVVNNATIRVNQKINNLTSEIPANTGVQLANLKYNLTDIVSVVNSDVSSIQGTAVFYFATAIVISVAIAVLIAHFVLPAKAPPEQPYYPPQRPYQPPQQPQYQQPPQKPSIFGKKKQVPPPAPPVQDEDE